MNPRCRLLLVVVVMACRSDGNAPPDAGDEAFVRRAVPLLWGRKPLGLAEVEALLQVQRSQGRDGLIRVMARSEAYRERWAQVMWDSMSIARVGKQTTRLCFGVETAAGGTPALAEWVRDHEPHEYGPPDWTFGDLVSSSLLLDDLSPLWRANILGYSARDRDANTFVEALAHRRILGELFLRNYTGRALECLPCHNSEWSVSSSADPAQDRTWEVPGHWEEALWGASDGGDPEDFWPYFRRYGVVGGFVFSSEPNDFGFTPERGCIGTHVPGCAGCPCEIPVCASLPGCCEEAWTEPCAQACTQLDGTHCTSPVLVHPWGMDPRCGRLVNPNQLQDDLASDGAFFIEEDGPTSTVWDLEPHFDRGIRNLAQDGVPRSSEALADPDRSFAWLWALHIADRIWEEGTGHRLVIAHGMARNQAQRDLQVELATRFVDSGFSLVELLVALTEKPIWNAADPARWAEGSEPYVWDAVLDPWTVEDADPDRRGNGMGERVSGNDARVLQRGLHRAMGWLDPPEFMGGDEADEQPMQRLQETLGVWQKEGNRGFRGVGFQQALAWEAAYGACRDSTPRPWGCLSQGDPGCQGCLCEAAVCAEMPECCLSRWSPDCAALCAVTGCAPRDPVPPDVIDLALAAAPAGLSAEQGVSFVKDRLLADPDLSDPDERAALEVVLGQDLADPLVDAEGLRAACAVFLCTPDYLLRGEPGPQREGSALLWEPPGFNRQEVCQRVEAELLVALDCD